MDEEGFSLAEILAAAAILGILSAIAIPRLFLQYSAVRLEQEAAKLAAALSYYRAEVMYAESQRQGFADVSEQRVPSFILTRKGYYVRYNTKIDRRYTFPDGVELVSNRTSAEFYGTGNGEPMTIMLRQGASARYVIIDLAGRIRVSTTPP